VVRFHTTSTKNFSTLSLSFQSKSYESKAEGESERKKVSKYNFSTLISELERIVHNESARKKNGENTVCEKPLEGSKDWSQK